MKRLYNKCTYFLIGAFFLGLTTNCFGNVFLKNENIVDKRAVKRIEIMGKELKALTGISTYILAINSLQGNKIVLYEQNISKTLKKPYILLTLSKEDKQVDIISSDDVSDKFDKKGILSPYPWSGTILPILASKDAKDKYSAAILNGYGDIVDQIATSYDKKLNSSIGNANKSVIGILKFIFYAFCVISIGIVIYRKRKKIGNR